MESDIINENLDNVRCKSCGNETVLAKNEIVPTGIFKFRDRTTTYHVCINPICNFYTQVNK